jgi:hypothetical protein
MFCSNGVEVSCRQGKLTRYGQQIPDVLADPARASIASS